MNAMLELLDEEDDLVTVTALAAINARRQRTSAPAPTAHIPTYRPARTVTPQPTVPTVEVASDEKAFDPFAPLNPWASRGGWRKMSTAQKNALASASSTGVIYRSARASIVTLKALIKLGYATPIEGAENGYMTLVAAAITPRGRAAAGA